MSQSHMSAELFETAAARNTRKTAHGRTYFLTKNFHGIRRDGSEYLHVSHLRAVFWGRERREEQGRKRNQNGREMGERNRSERDRAQSIDAADNYVMCNLPVNVQQQLLKMLGLSTF